MPIAVLTLLKLVLLALLYLFLYRVVRAILADLYGPRRRRPPKASRPTAAPDSSSRRTRKPPKELVIHPPDGQPNVVALEHDRVTIGRSPQMSVRLEDVYVSDEHAQVGPDDDGWVVRDLGSTNGTYLNGAKVTQPTQISAGDQIRVGKTRIEVRR